MARWKRHRHVLRWHPLARGGTKWQSSAVVAGEVAVWRH